MVKNTTDGMIVLQRVAGKDASKQFWKYHNESILKKYQKLKVGSLDSKAAAEPQKAPAPAPAEKKSEQKVAEPKAESGTASAQPGPDAGQLTEALEPFGDMIPGADPNWSQSVCLHVIAIC